MNLLGYGWNVPTYGATNGGYGYAYGNQPHAGSYYQPQPYSYILNPGISYGFQRYIYPTYSYLPNLSNLLKSGAYGALKGAGAGAAIGGIVGLLG
ncbi:Kinesin-like protein [Dirofilaria immitis]